jgi:hypothetical protein
MRPFPSILGLALLAASSACGKTNFGSGCEKPAELTAPWTDMGLPIDASLTRVCESTAADLKLRSYAWKGKDEAGAALESALTSAGWTKDRCTGQACYFDKDGFQVSVQPMDFEVKKKTLATVAMRYTEDRTQKGKRAAAPDGNAKDAEGEVAAAAAGGLGVSECDDYVATVEACATFDRSAKVYTTMMDKWRKEIAAGNEDAVAQACSKAAGMFKCRGS